MWYLPFYQWQWWYRQLWSPSLLYLGACSRISLSPCPGVEVRQGISDDVVTKWLSVGVGVGGKWGSEYLVGEWKRDWEWMSEWMGE